jgi:hypothetical protein
MNLDMSSIPNVFVIGAPKSGTSAVVDALGGHPNIFVPDNKEPRYFDAHIFYDKEEDYPIKSVAEYLALYKADIAKGRKFRVDGSVFTMYSERAVKDILALSPEAKFILVVRDPLTATKSMFLQRLKYVDSTMREVSHDFPACWRMLAHRRNGKGYPVGCKTKFIFRYDLLYSYEKYLPSLERIIPDGQLLIVRYDLLKDYPQAFYSSLLDFLGLDSNFQLASKIVNPSNIVENGVMGRFLLAASNLTRPLRAWLGLAGIFSLHNWLIKNQALDKADLRLNEIDKDVDKEFEETFIYLKARGYTFDRPSRESEKVHDVVVK